MRANRLLPSPTISPAQVVQEVFAIQAQELPAARLSIRARSSGLTAAGVEQARLEERSLAWTWCLRGTLHLVAAEDARWLVPLLGPRLIAAGRRRMAELGWDEQLADQGLRLVRQAVEKDGPLTRPEIARLLKENNLPHEGQAPVHLLYRAALEGILCHGPDRDGEHTYTLFEDWLGSPQPLPRPEALAQLALRYLQAYAPATSQDFAAWAGLGQGKARQAWQGIAGQIVEVTITDRPSGAGQAWLLKSQLAWLDETLETGPTVRLLPRFDTFWMGYAGRHLLVDKAYTRRVNRGGGIIRPLLLVDGRVLGTWETRRSKGGLQILLDPFEPLPGELLPLIEVEAADIGRFLGEEVKLV